MTKDEALKLALDALEGFIPYLPLKDEAQCNSYDKAITALRLAIDEQNMASKSTYKEQLETKDAPVAWMSEDEHTVYTSKQVDGCFQHDHIPLYTTPPQRKPLTDEQILHIVSTHIGEISPSYRLDNSDWINFSHAIEAAHGIKE